MDWIDRMEVMVGSAVRTILATVGSAVRTILVTVGSAVRTISISSQSRGPHSGPYNRSPSISWQSVLPWSSGR